MLRWPVAIFLGVLPLAVVAAYALATHQPASASGQADKSVTIGEFVSHTRSICRRLHRAEATLPQPGSQAEIRSVMATSLRLSERAVRELHKLRPPALLASSYASALRDMRELNRLTRHVLEQPAGSWQSEMAAVAPRGRHLSAQLATLAPQLGLKLCVK